MNRIILLLLVSVLIVSCSSHHIVRIENEQKGNLTSIYELFISDSVQYCLDIETAPKSSYMQIYEDSLNTYLTLLNSYNNSIYLYDNRNQKLVKRISYDKEGANGILGMGGYYIKNMDSIYIYNRPLLEILLTDSTGKVKEHISLRSLDADWINTYPQYDLSSACPIFEKNGKLILTGFSPFAIKESLLNNFRYTAYIDIKSKQVEFHHTYPMNLYGDDMNWDDPVFMQMYCAISPDGNLIHSFPISHDLIINKFASDDSTVVYGGCNVASTISSIDWDLFKTQKTPTELVFLHYLKQDLYGAIIYDPWRKVYYRFMQKGILNASTKNSMDEKQIVLILFDDKFNYLGEKMIGNGKNWYISNAFVTDRGLNIQYLDQNDIEELYLNFKVFTIAKIEKQ